MLCLFTPSSMKINAPIRANTAAIISLVAGNNFRLRKSQMVPPIIKIRGRVSEGFMIVSI